MHNLPKFFNMLVQSWANVKEEDLPEFERRNRPHK